MKKTLKIALWAIVALVLALCVAAAAIWNGEIKTIGTISQVDTDGYLYRMEYKASYDLDELVDADVDSNAKLLEYVVKKVGKGLPIKMKSSQVVEDGEEKGFSCTSFQALKEGGSGYWYGRNYDFFKNPTLVTVSHPKNGYASIGVSDMSHFGYSLEKLPKTFLSKVLCLAAIYAPVDGINEKGVCTSIMALPHQASQQNTGRHVVGTTVIMRLILDRCATVQEALDLVNSLDIRHDAAVGSGYHYMVADAQGNCAVIEFDKDDCSKTMIVRKSDSLNFMHVTNHLLSEKYFTTEPDPQVGNPHSRSWWRYDVVNAYMSERNGCLTADQADECLQSVHWKDLVWDNGLVEDTQWSALYDQSALKLSLRVWNRYSDREVFELQ